MTESPEPDAAEGVEAPVPPVTGHNGIDAALAALELGPDVHTHPEQISAAIDAVARALQTPAPGLTVGGVG
ncbi:MAG: hypothetical protein L0G22_06215 [Propionibacteriaceae bacterium]|nr:hypothetical protein [Propionibacteriaceae bacterium]